MKKSDIAVLIVIISVVALIVYFSIKLVIGDQTLQPVSVEISTRINSSITPPSSSIFNERAINPTVPISIEGGDQKPIGN